MSKLFMFMNEEIKKKKPSRPVIVVQREGQQTESNEVELACPHCYTRIGRVVYDPKGNPEVKTHLVKAWVEIHD